MAIPMSKQDAKLQLDMKRLELEQQQKLMHNATLQQEYYTQKKEEYRQHTIDLQRRIEQLERRLGIRCQLKK